MTIPKPTDLTCRHQSGWAYITVPTKRGHSQQVEFKDGSTWRDAALVDGEWLVPMYAHGQRTDFRARYGRAGDSSPWTDGQVWMPDGFSYDGSTPQVPDPPYALRNRWPSSGNVQLSWSQHGQVDGWRVHIAQNGQEIFDELVSESYVEVFGLAYDRPVEVDIRAVAGPAESDSLLQHYPDFNYRPATPQQLIVGASPSSLSLEWLQEDCCEEWQVLWRPADQGALRSTDEVSEGMHGETGNVIVTGDPEYVIDGLSADTEYSLLIAARWRRSSYSQESLTARHATDSGGSGLRKPRLRKGTVTDTSIEVLWDDDVSATEWVVRRTPGHSRHRPTGHPRWLAEGLSPETSYEFGVIAVDDDHGLESEEATITITTTGDVPPPSGPSVPQQLRVHCIHATHAKVEWDENPIEEDVKYYQLRVTGPDSTQKDVNGTLQIVEGLEPETSYRAAVRACNDVGCSAWSAPVPFTTMSDQPPPDPDPPSSDVPKPTGLYLDPVRPGVVKASWDRPADDRIWWLASIDGRTWWRLTYPSAELEIEPGTEATVEVYALLNGAGGNPTKISAIASAGVVTARKGA